MLLTRNFENVSITREFGPLAFVGIETSAAHFQKVRPVREFARAGIRTQNPRLLSQLSYTSDQNARRNYHLNHNTDTPEFPTVRSSTKLHATHGE